MSLTFDWSVLPTWGQRVWAAVSEDALEVLDVPERSSTPSWSDVRFWLLVDCTDVTLDAREWKPTDDFTDVARLWQVRILLLILS